MTVAIIKDRHVRIIIMRPETILHRGRIHFRRLLLVPTNSSCSSAADHTCYINHPVELLPTPRLSLTCPYHGRRILLQ